MKYLVSSILGFSLLATLAFAANPKISHDIESLDPASTANVIVQFAEVPTAVQHKKVTDRGGVYRATLSIVKAGSYAVPVSALSDLAGDPDVVYISPDRPLRGMLDNTTAAVNAATAWSAGLTGTGIGVALIDSGVTPDSDLSSTLTYNQTFITNDTHDYYGHGTHVAGILAGSGARSHSISAAEIYRGSPQE